MKFKHKKDKEMILTLHPVLLMIFFDLSWYAKYKHNVDLTITQTVSTPEQDERLGRTSMAHQQCRAIDVRTKDLDAFMVSDMVSYLNNKSDYENFRYLSTSGVKRIAYWHNSGHGEHMHISIHSRFKVD